MNKGTSVVIMIILAVIGIVSIIFAINYFDIDPGGITQQKGELSFGATSKLGWILTFVFFVLYLIFSVVRRLYYKLTGRV